jgi:hypothetical protein
MRYLYTRMSLDPTEHASIPVEQYVELDDEYWETRVVELMHDGSVQYASEELRYRRDDLSDQPYVRPEEFRAERPGWIYCEISREEFEQVWARTLAEHPPRGSAGE